MPENYTSYDYGAAIRETRQLDPKYYEDKLIGYFTQSVAPLTKTDAIRADAAGQRGDRRHRADEPRHRDAVPRAAARRLDVDRRSTRTHIAIDFNATAGRNHLHLRRRRHAALQYTGTWSHVANQSYTGGDYKHTESFSNTAGDSRHRPLHRHGGPLDRLARPTTTASPTSTSTASSRRPSTPRAAQNQAVLSPGDRPDRRPAHAEDRRRPARTARGSTDNFVSIDAIDVPTGAAAGARPTRSCRSSPAPRSPSTGATRTSSSPNYKLGGDRSCSTRPRRS